tara:strand:- start:5667 stop:6386 length:720 start_codon:yes stop_codon:yes gene_type:complete
MWVNESKKLLFIHIPKTGGSSLVETFEKSDEWRSLAKELDAHQTYEIDSKTYENGETKHREAKWLWHANELQLRPLTQYKDFQKFSIARNPWARILSLYLFLLKQSEYILSTEDCGWPNETIDWARVSHCQLTSKGFSGSLEPEGVIGHLNQPEHLDPRGWHELQPCSSWMQNGTWFKLENMKELEDFLELKIKKTNTTKHTHYSQYYSTKDYLKVKKWFKDDIEKFGYNFETLEKTQE